jgi:hypothetical protein
MLSREVDPYCGFCDQQRLGLSRYVDEWDSLPQDQPRSAPERTSTRELAPQAGGIGTEGQRDVACRVTGWRMKQETRVQIAFEVVAGNI